MNLPFLRLRRRLVGPTKHGMDGPPLYRSAAATMYLHRLVASVAIDPPPADASLSPRPPPLYRSDTAPIVLFPAPASLVWHRSAVRLC